MRPPLALTATLLSGLVVVALVAPLLPLPDPVRMAIGQRFGPPSAAHWLGQDQYGRDVLARLLAGARISLAVAAGAALIAGVVGTALGVAGGYLRGVAEAGAMRSMDVLLCFPPLLLALLVVTLAGPGAATLVPILALVYVPGFARVAHAGVVLVREQDYVAAQRALGAGRLRIMLRTILPNVAGPILVQLSLTLAAGIVLESGLSFLGLGVVPPAPSWGLMIAEARATMARAPLLVLWPCLALTLTVILLNAFCDALRDRLDPRSVVPRRRRLLDYAAPGLLPAVPDAPVLDVRNLAVAVGPPDRGVLALRDVSFAIRAGETVALVGESGSGKSLTSLAIMRLLPPGVEVVAGSIVLEGEHILALDERAMRRRRGAAMAMIFQDPATSLNPVYRVGDQIGEAVAVHGGKDPAGRSVALLRMVGMPDPKARARVFPHELSGGMRQRVMIATAVANRPKLLIADEPTTALDVTVQAQILDRLAELKRETGAALLFITHALPVVAEIADRVIVMYAGEIVEEGATDAVFLSPCHPYTAALLASAPDATDDLPIGIPGSVPSIHARPPGCSFAPRCDHRIAACEAAVPPLVEVRAGRRSRCIRWSELCPAS